MASPAKGFRRELDLGAQIHDQRRKHDGFLFIVSRRNVANVARRDSGKPASRLVIVLYQTAPPRSFMRAPSKLRGQGDSRISRSGLCVILHGDEKKRKKEESVWRALACFLLCFALLAFRFDVPFACRLPARCETQPRLKSRPQRAAFVPTSLGGISPPSLPLAQPMTPRSRWSAGLVRLLTSGRWVNRFRT